MGNQRSFNMEASRSRAAMSSRAWWQWVSCTITAEGSRFLPKGIKRRLNYLVSQAAQRLHSKQRNHPAKGNFLWQQGHPCSFQTNGPLDSLKTRRSGLRSPYEQYPCTVWRTFPFRINSSWCISRHLWMRKIKAIWAVKRFCNIRRERERQKRLI
jgi:hypothetical protein